MAEIMAEIFCSAPTARTRQRNSLGSTPSCALFFTPGTPAKESRARSAGNDARDAARAWQRTALEGAIDRASSARFLEDACELRQEGVLVEQRHRCPSLRCALAWRASFSPFIHTKHTRAHRSLCCSCQFRVEERRLPTRTTNRERGEREITGKPLSDSYGVRGLLEIPYGHA